ncbi:DUF2493 domain-containing protein [Microbispora rosea]|uniref:DUF2493 domain-containing protein n=1 Tax=Microbispora rosea TaxID=58117 RepID=UPI0037B2722C
MQLYITGYRCTPHSPAALAGHPKPGQGAYCAPLRHYCLATEQPCPDAPKARSWRLLVTGSRNHTGKAFIWQVMDGYHADHPDMLVIHGACYPKPNPDGSRLDKSADWLTHLWCQARGVQDEPHPADWQQHGDAAGPIRNQAMVDLGADECAAFPKGGSRGTADCMRRAEKAGIPVRRWAAS